ncbi:MAG: methyltransferase domain-containing protein [Leptospiraceae bacterium]|nr:methyltransferase domain-containing protein [Leptospiraceae bacterium]
MSRPEYKIKSTNYNDISLRLARKIFGIEHLHYGFFTKGIKRDIQHVPQAQEAYVKNLLKYIPRGVKSIFDVGCGTGGIAEELVKKRYNVACVAPDPYLTNLAAEKTKGRAQVFTDLYENLDAEPTPGSFDLVLMAESCQYVNPERGWEQHGRFLKDKGYVLIADFFKIRPLDRDDLSKSGHDLDRFLSVADESGFKLLKKIDITRETAPSMDIYQGIITQYVFPIAEAIFEFISRRYPLIYRFMSMLFKEKILKLHARYSNQSAAIFTQYKGYFILLFQKK